MRNSPAVLGKNYKLLVLPLSLFLLGFSQYDGEGKATITPSQSTLLEEGEYTLKFVVGEHGIAVGGGIKTRFPKRWMSQVKDPSKDYFLKVNLSRKSSGYRVTIRRKDDSLDGQCEKQAYTITLKIIKEPLIEGDTISLTLFKKRVRYFSAHTTTLPVVSDVDGDGTFSLIKELPHFTIRAGDPERIYAVAPTTQQIGKEFKLKVAILDKISNAADYTGTIGFASSDKKAVLPKSYTFSKTDGGVKKFPVVLNTPGYHTITVSDKSKNWRRTSNPIDCRESEYEEKIWWGDLHSHSEISGDAIGNSTFEYARDVAGLDFYSLTDHSGSFLGEGKGITDEEWIFIKKKTIEFDDPGKFVTILGFECSMRSPSGHHNVYFNCSNDIIPGIPILRRADVSDDILILWQKLKQTFTENIDVITIPHHTGMLWYKNGLGTYVSFERPYHNPQMRVAIEIFSNRGLSEKYDLLNPLSYNNIIRDRSKKPKRHTISNKRIPYNGPHYTQDAWAKRKYLGVIASSDSHNAHPGMMIVRDNAFKARFATYNPLVGVYAKGLTRDSIFNAIKARRTYATTGERIILNFNLNGYPMGSEVELEKEQKPKISVKVRGTDLIDFVEILKWDFVEGEFDKDNHPMFEAIFHKKINAMEVNFKIIDDNIINDCLYYVRLKQAQTIRENEAWAWSSPIWEQ
jgi:hypothetical protein